MVKPMVEDANKMAGETQSKQNSFSSSETDEVVNRVEFEA